jgi:hypothetical protein
MTATKRRIWLAALVALLAAGNAGCAYLSNRGDDVLDCVDLGVTYSTDPKITLYANFLNILPIGYSNFDGQYYGTGNDHVGAMQARHDHVGLIAWGYERWGYDGDYDPADPKSPTSFYMGIGGIGQAALVDQEHFPWKNGFVTCPKMIHLGWVGLSLNCKFGEVLDLVLGVFTIDLFNDDDAGREPDTPPEPEPDPADAAPE